MDRLLDQVRNDTLVTENMTLPFKLAVIKMGGMVDSATKSAGRVLLMLRFLDIPRTGSAFACRLQIEEQHV